jgi:hypothetical protein
VESPTADFLLDWLKSSRSDPRRYVASLSCRPQVRTQPRLLCLYGRTLSYTVPAACTSPTCQNLRVYRSCGTFSYQERLLQQNGDIGKRDGVTTTCIWAHLVQGHIRSSPSLPPPPLSPPFKCNKQGSWPALCFLPFTPPPPPPIGLWTDFGSLAKNGGWTSCEYDS